MSYVKEIRFSCDHFTLMDGICRREKAFPLGLVREARKTLAELGWTRTVEGYDRCPKHKGK